ncbi:MAG: DUF523 domain-containing protein [Anaeroplasmataceae bacterium]|nr:DUF523 domain-containing protein [Anaeroplasmataceae bacterium]
MKEKLLISACLCGKNTKYNGGNNLISNLDKIKERYELYLVCPEVMGGLTIPRNPSEILGSLVLSNQNIDVTKEYHHGAEQALKIVLKNKIKKALLKESSPSCGSHFVYDGTFTGKKINGEGITVQLLKQHNIEIFSENQIEELLK